MNKNWSISTAIRNPYRLRRFLSVLKKLEGRPFTRDNQVEYQILLIQEKIYKPTNLTEEQERFFMDIEKEMPYETAAEIFMTKEYEDPTMRGRVSITPLNRMGLCIAKQSMGEIKITPLGEYFLSEDHDLGKLFFIHFLKWQLPNPIDTSFSLTKGFNIKPFVGTLHLIEKVNNLWRSMGKNPVGINKDEFSLFIPTLIDYRKVDEQAKRLIEYRIDLRSCKKDKEEKEFRDSYRKTYAREILGMDNDAAIEKLINNLKDYGDNIIRYFRLTRFLHIRGGGFYIDLEPRRMTEINKLLFIDNAAPLEFKDTNAYMEYLSDIDLPELPWETKSELAGIANNLENDIRDYVSRLKSNMINIPELTERPIEKLRSEQLKRYIEELRAYLRNLRESEINFESQDIPTIRRYIEALKNIHRSSNKKSIELERLSTLALNALNDALEIKPNYPVGDDYEPTFTAPANKPDIECFYEQFNSVCEVTMLTNRSQWYNEGQPVMRHIRNFEDIHTEKLAYCLFIAPRLHQDTVETFWVAVKHGYMGARQRIIPLSISQFIKLLETLLEIKEQGKQFTHGELLDLYERILRLTDHVAHSGEWIKRIPEVIAEWRDVIRIG